MIGLHYYWKAFCKIISLHYHFWIKYIYIYSANVQKTKQENLIDGCRKATQHAWQDETDRPGY
jgi:hypothetical protein